MIKGITDVPGISVGHVTDAAGMTGCTVVLVPGEGAVAGVDVRGSAPGTRETDLLKPMNLVQRVHAVILCGGSAFGLDAAAGVMKFLEEKNIGYDTGAAKVPIVPAAVLYDLAVGDAKARPTAEMGYLACLSANTGRVPEGNCGAGAGATVAKHLGMDHAVKGGVGTHSVRLDNGVVIGAIAAVNAYGDILDWKTGETIAAPRNAGTDGFTSTMDLLKGCSEAPSVFPANTTLAVVATNAKLTKEMANKVAQVAHNGLARAINPVHTLVDGDAVFAVSVGELECDPVVVGAVAAEVVAESIKRAVLQAKSIGHILAVQDLNRNR